MKKIITKAVCLLCAGALVLGAAGCSKSADSSSAASSTAAAVYGSAEDYDYENFSYSSGLDENGYWEGVKALDYVTLPENFASLTFKRSEIEPTEEEIQSEIDSLLSDHATEKQVTDRAAADGDTVNIDYAGSVDGVAFSGGTYSGYSLTLGSGTFVDGFEDQIVGHTPGETFDVTVTFPEGYSDSTDSEGNTVVLSGKKAVFSVTLNYISEKVLPELTDAWVAENYGESDDVHTVEELKAFFSSALYDQNLEDAIMDALLGAAALGDIGQHFPDTDPAYKGADSLALTREVAKIIAQHGYKVGNIDATILCQRPKLAPHIPAMRQNIADAFGLPLDAVSVKATTEEHLGFTGEGLGIAAHAVALIE